MTSRGLVTDAPAYQTVALEPSPNRLWWTLVILGAALRAVIMPYGGYPSDIEAFKAWAMALAAKGPGGFYGAQFADYLPGYLYVLWLIGELHAYLRFNDQALLFVLKLPATAADVLGAIVLRGVATRIVSPRAAWWTGVCYLFHPALIFTSAYWGQADSVGALAALGALWLFMKDSRWAWPVAAVAFLIKPQTTPLLLVMVAVLARLTLRPPERAAGVRVRPDALVAAGFAGAATLLILIAPFRLGAAGLIRLLRSAVNVYPYGSIVAFNLWGAVQGFWVTDTVVVAGLTLRAWGTLLALTVIIPTLAAAWRDPSDRTLMLAGATALTAAFLLPTRIHERYLLPAVPLLALAGALDRRALAAYVWLSVVLLVNLVYAYTRPSVGTFLPAPWLASTILSDGAARVFSAAALAALPLLLWSLWRRIRVQPAQTA